ncbi:alpha/beta hydrolase [Salinimicrobium sp. TH3]|uniref:alpha/beta hydrolase n=1 Tax=Salinimicrobium sp. TH3 TaxID=2997342 RepID=UPI002272B941|nr:alpha/beta hydrolase-fold protein [Salinimicrobium sp. TH3]MCY2686297.1 alpha/beta hydrolase-fold protein [Salinimicrobium sp. TH3]
MKKLYLFTLFFLAVQLTFSQTIYKTINSSKLRQQRELKIQLPRNYDQNTGKKYPVIIVLDGDYLFEPMAGNVDYYSYWDEIPESIVVGVNQVRSRNDDCLYNPKTFLPEKEGAQFFEFLGMELLPFIDNTYRTSKFVAIAGHDYTSNFINYYLFKPDPLFHAYINLSPDLAPEMSNRLVEALSTAEAPKWFYLATGSNDVPDLKKNIRALDQQLSLIENQDVHYQFDDFDAATHYTLVGNALPRALEHIFSSYKPISLKEYDELVIMEKSAFNYLVEKYEVINNNFGIEKPVRINDFLAVGKALEYREKWDDLERLGDLAQKQYPHMALGDYYLARSYEANGRPKKAMKTYQSAYGKEEVAFVTIDFMLKKADLIKQDFGY